MANGTTRFVQELNTSCKCYLFTLPYGECWAKLAAKARQIMQVTGGCNTHRGAIWTLGLLGAAARSLARSKWTAAAVCGRAAVIARLPDSARFPDSAPRVVSHGELAVEP